MKLRVYTVVKLNFTPEIEIFHMLFEISLSICSITSLKQYAVRSFLVLNPVGPPCTKSAFHKKLLKQVSPNHFNTSSLWHAMNRCRCSSANELPVGIVKREASSVYVLLLRAFTASLSSLLSWMPRTIKSWRRLEPSWLWAKEWISQGNFHHKLTSSHLYIFDSWTLVH